MKKIFFVLLMLPTFCFADATATAVNAPWESFLGPFDSWISGKTIARMAVPHGWLVNKAGSNIVFLPDENHEWALETRLLEKPN